ncbi:MAG: Gfo/Idh/MocA family oxidoreductase [Clostridiales bacterium]|jgi:predicted dehydrogenase|nr:Gfo/Idh/MocA family oxidoreductase [Clostridiales bacterium]
MLRVGILGCGTIAAKIAESLKGNKKAVIAGVASRERNKAKKFAAAHCPDAKVFTGYEKLAASDEIDLVYIATPNTYHYEHAIMCIKEYKNILVEKPFAMSKAEADSIFFEAKNRGIFVAEAMWTSYQPLHLKALEWIEKGRIGAVKYVSANLGYDIASVPRLNSPVLGGGSYLDLGVYTTNFALSFMGNDIKVSRVFARRVSSGIDRDTSYCLESEDGSILGNFYVTMCADTDKDGVVVGERGKIKFTNINNYRKIAIYSNDDTLLEEVDGDKEFLRGYVYEFESCANAISKGLIQAPEMPWSKTVRIAQINDTIRSMM